MSNSNVLSHYPTLGADDEGKLLMKLKVEDSL